ncbi:ferroxidase fet3 [Coemansia erecta]|nr:ferroxidase fet3 [Coemansia erecta]
MLALVYLLLGVLGLQTLAKRVEVNWDVGYLNISRDGYSTWQAIGANGQLPIPPIYVTQGDTLVLTAHNSLDKPFSLHAHGLFQRNSSYYDGPAMVTECGIPPGESFTYVIETRDQVGSFWVHGHYYMEAIDGLRTALIIRAKTPSDYYDEDILITLEEWEQMPYAEFVDRMQSVPSGKLIPNFPTVLINGINGNVSNSIHFTPGKRYRIRFVSMSFTYWFKVQLPDHTMSIIEADGIDSEPAEVDGLDMCPGQRYSVLVTAHDTDAFNYMFNVTFYSAAIERVPGLMPRYYQIPVIYRDNSPVKQLPALEDSEVTWSNEFSMIPQDKQKILHPVDRWIELQAKRHFNSFGIPTFAFGDYAYKPGLVPALYTALSMGDLALNESVYAPQLNAFVVKHMDVVEIVITNDNTVDHSYHMHGHAFQVVELGPTPNNTMRPLPAIKKSLHSPMRRDTITLPTHQYVKLRFRADNPGVWYQHCHQKQHDMTGLAFTIVEAPDVLQKTQRVPQRMLDFCAMLGKKTFGNSAGNSGFNFTGIESPILVIENKH